jgi:hypothetical protein
MNAHLAQAPDPNCVQLVEALQATVDAFDRCPSPVQRLPLVVLVSLGDSTPEPYSQLRKWATPFGGMTRQTE